MTVSNDSKEVTYWEEREYRDNDGHSLPNGGDGCKLKSFSIVVNGIYIATNEYLLSGIHALSNELNGKVYTMDNIRCTLSINNL